LLGQVLQLLGQTGGLLLQVALLGRLLGALRLGVAGQRLTPPVQLVLLARQRPSLLRRVRFAGLGLVGRLSQLLGQLPHRLDGLFAGLLGGGHLAVLRLLGGLLGRLLGLRRLLGRRRLLALLLGHVAGQVGGLFGQIGLLLGQV